MRRRCCRLPAAATRRGWLLRRPDVIAGPILFVPRRHRCGFHAARQGGITSSRAASQDDMQARRSGGWLVLREQQRFTPQTGAAPAGHPAPLHSAANWCAPCGQQEEQEQRHGPKCEADVFAADSNRFDCRLALEQVQPLPCTFGNTCQCICMYMPAHGHAHLLSREPAACARSRRVTMPTA